jgi:hypothetical protein
MPPSGGCGRSGSSLTWESRQATHMQSEGQVTAAGAPDITVEISDYSLTVTFVYENDRTRQWAEEVCGSVAKFAGNEVLRMSFWNIADLAQESVLLQAVRAAVRADLIVVCVGATATLPIDLCVWCDVWLPRRLQGIGALVLLTDPAEESQGGRSIVHEYCRAVARKGGLDFIARGPYTAPTRRAPLGPFPLAEVDHMSRAEHKMSDWSPPYPCAITQPTAKP